MSDTNDKTAASKKRIVLLESESLFASSVASLLLNQSDIEVISASFEALEGTDALAQMQPDVLILEDKVMRDHLVALVEFIENYPKLRAVVLNTGSNRIHVFDEVIVQVNHIRDFLDVL